LLIEDGFFFAIVISVFLEFLLFRLFFSFQSQKSPIDRKGISKIYLLLFGALLTFIGGFQA
jgi:hypothetical protein